MGSTTNPTIGLVVITNRLNENNAVFTAVQNFIDLFEDTAESIEIFGPEQMSIDRDLVELQRIKRYDRPTPVHEIVYHLYLQLRLTHALVKRRNEIDLVFFHLGGTVLLLPLLFSRILRLNPIVIVTTESVSTAYMEQHEETIATRVISTAIDVLEIVSSRMARRVVFLSETMKSQFPPLGKDRTAVANLNYIDTEAFNSQIPESERQFDLLFVGRFEKVKGIEKFVQSVSILAQNRPEISVGLVGDGSLKPEVERIIAENNLKENVKLFGWVDRERIPQILGDARYLVLPSEAEGVPKTLLEAMACGTVPIATRVGGIPDILEHGDTGYLLSSNEPKQMADEIIAFIEDSEWYPLSSRAQQYVVTSHSFRKCRDKYISIIKEFV